MTTRQLEATESPSQDPLSTPQFTDNKGFFASRQDALLEELLESPPMPMTFRPTKHESTSRPVRVGKLCLDDQAKGDLEALGLEVDDEVDEETANPNRNIEELRDQAERAILEIKQQYLQRERGLAYHLPAEEQEMLELTRPDSLQDRKPRDEVVYGSTDSHEEIRSHWESDVKALKDEVESLRKHVADAENGAFIQPNPLTKQKIQDIIEQSLKVSPKDSDSCVHQLLIALESDILSREAEIRKELELIFESEKEQIREAYEEQMTKAVEDTRREATEFWKGKKQGGEDVQRLKERLTVEIEGRLKAEYEEKLKKRVSQMAPTRRGEEYEIRERLRELEAYRENQEMEFALRLEAEKEAWKREQTSLQLEDHRAALEAEFAQKLADRTSEIQAKSRMEVTQMAAQFRSEAQEAISQHLKRLSEESDRKGDSVKSLLREECMREMRSEREMKLADALAARLSVQLEKDLKKDLAPKVEKELRIMYEEQIRTQLRKEFEDVYETRRAQLDQEMRYKLRTAQERVEGKFEEDVTRLLAEKTAKIEKELKIKYKTKLERIKKQAEEAAQMEYEKKKEEEQSDLKRDKTEVARLKSALNIQLKKAATERKEMMDTIHHQELELERRAKELSYQLTRVQVQEAHPSLDSTKHSRLNPPSKPESSAQKQRESRISPRAGSDTDMIVTLPVPSSPPEMASQSRSLTEREHEKDMDSPPRFLPRYDSQDLVKQLITKNLEEAQREAISLLRETEKPPVITSPYYPRDVDTTQVSKQQTTAPLYYRSKEAEMRKELARAQEAPPQSARHQLYQELLKERSKTSSQRNSERS